MPSDRPPVVCLGEALVDVLCERPVSGLAEADAFVPRFGGALANVAVAAARAGAPAALLGGVGDDEWGRWLRSRLAAEGVDTTDLAEVEGLRTPVVFVTYDAGGEIDFAVYGETIGPAIAAAADRVEPAIERAAALVFGSNTLVSEPEMGVTLAAHRAALDASVPVCFDPNLRANRWSSLDRAREHCLRVCDRAALVRTNREEGEWLTGERDAGAAGEALVAAGARLAVVSRGADGAIMRGAARADQPGVPTEVVTALGAGDAFMGTLVAGLAAGDFADADAAAALAPAVAAGGAACRHPGAQP